MFELWYIILGWKEYNKPFRIPTTTTKPSEPKKPDLIPVRKPDPPKTPSVPELPKIKIPEPPKTPEPPKEKTPDPPKPKTPEPKTPEIPKPKTPEIPKPKTPELPKPKTPEIVRPVVPDPPKPKTPDSPKPRISAEDSALGKVNGAGSPSPKPKDFVMSKIPDSPGQPSDFHLMEAGFQQKSQKPQYREQPVAYSQKTEESSEDEDE